MARITINGVSLDPMAQPTELLAARPEVEDASRSDYILIQTNKPLSSTEKGKLAKLGAVIQEYVPDNTYLCGYQPSDLTPVRDLPFVAWAGVYLRDFKINPSLRPAGGDHQPASIVPSLRAHPPSRKQQTIDVVMHDDVDGTAQATKELVAAAARIDPSALQAGPRKVRVTVEQGQFDELAELDEVRHIEAVPQRQLFNNLSRRIIDADVVLNGTTYLGDGEIVAVADTGFDTGSTSNVHPAFTGRVAQLYALGRPEPGEADDPNGHGTHVAGSVLGDGTSATMGGTIQGTAPEAQLILQTLLDATGGLGGIPVDLHDLFQPPYDETAPGFTPTPGAPHARPAVRLQRA